ncbi:hypothetical protein D3C75_788910 [compost metagenome]
MEGIPAVRTVIGIRQHIAVADYRQRMDIQFLGPQITDRVGQQPGIHTLLLRQGCFPFRRRPVIHCCRRFLPAA